MTRRVFVLVLEPTSVDASRKERRAVTVELGEPIAGNERRFGRVDVRFGVFGFINIKGGVGFRVVVERNVVAEIGGKFVVEPNAVLRFVERGTGGDRRNVRRRLFRFRRVRTPVVERNESPVANQIFLDVGAARQLFERRKRARFEIVGDVAQKLKNAVLRRRRTLRADRLVSDVAEGAFEERNDFSVRNADRQRVGGNRLVSPIGRGARVGVFAVGVVFDRNFREFANEERGGLRLLDRAVDLEEAAVGNRNFGGFPSLRNDDAELVETVSKRFRRENEERNAVAQRFKNRFLLTVQVDRADDEVTLRRAVFESAADRNADFAAKERRRSRKVEVC